MGEEKKLEEIIEKVEKEGFFSDLEHLILSKDWKEKLQPDTSRVAFLPVRPDWNEPRKMWGYYNPLTGLFYPTDALMVLLNAYRDYVKNKDPNKKYFIILDEMNLARVEYYMSDLLSLMENMCSVTEDGEKIQISEMAMVHPLSRCVLSRLPEEEEWKKHKEEWKKYVKEENGELKWEITGEKYCMEECKGCPYQALKEGVKTQEKTDDKKEDFIKAFQPIPPRIAYPENLVIIGTVNVDETTFSFAPKVLDRAFVVEFNEVHVKEYCEEYGIGNEKFKNFVKDLHQILKPANLHFGYRVISEMWKYLKKNGEQDSPSDDSLDFLLCSKVLPKIHGGEERVGKVLEGLLAFCATEIEEAKKTFEVEGWHRKVEIIKEDDKEKLIIKDEKGETKEIHLRFPKSAQKILEMYRRLKDTGYCSFF
uniref:Hypothetical conserved protein n=1 Tax=uncultured prokaryote TaxID=198431 RepID=H5SPY7_9ZZZZ|nr:hypothetical conserved protein [uncultured prokaryote]